MPETATSTAPAIYKPWTGRPPLYQPHELYAKLDEYMAYAKNAKTMPNLPEFIAYLDISADTWERYKVHKLEGYRRATKRAESWIESSVVSNGLLKNIAGQIFYLKNKHGYTDKREVSHTGEVRHAHLHAELDGKLNRMLLGDGKRGGDDVQDAEIVED